MDEDLQRIGSRKNTWRRMRGYTILLPATVSLLVMGCDQRGASSHPVDVTTARRSVPFSLPLPDSAANVEFSWRSGGTQDWELWLKFNDSSANVENLAKKELIFFSHDTGMRREDYLKRPLREARFGTSWSAPSWWKPDAVQSGWYMGSLGYSGPRVWMDTASNTAYLYENW